MSSLAEQLEPNLDIYPDLKPLPALPPVAQWDYDLVPEILRDYIKDVSIRMQCPPDFVAVAAVVGLAGVAGAKFRVFPKQLDSSFSIVPNLWGALVGAPSSMKSPTLSEGLRPLSSLQAEARKVFEEQRGSFEIEKEISEMAIKFAKDEAGKAMKAGSSSKHKAKQIIEAAKADSPFAPVLKRYIVNDSTVAKLGELLRDSPEGLLLVRDELSGWLADMQSESKQADRAFYLECFNGNASYTVDRIERGEIHIPNACVSIVGGLQPSKLAPLVRGAVSGSSDDGLLQRFQLAVWPDPVKGKKYIDQRINEKALGRFTEAYRRIDAFELDLESGPIKFRFSKDAQAYFIEWWNEIESRVEADDMPSALESHLIKMKKTVPSLALLFALVDGAEGEVEARQLLQALEWSDYLMSHAHRVYGVGMTGSVTGAKTLLRNKAKLKGEFSVRDIYRKGWSGLGDKSSADDALTLLVDHNYLLEHEIQSSAIGGRPTTFYTWNPKVGV